MTRWMMKIVVGCNGVDSLSINMTGKPVCQVNPSFRPYFYNDVKPLVDVESKRLSGVVWPSMLKCKLIY